MDPKQCLIDCLTAMADLDELKARDRLEAYASWRNKGGFEPTLTDTMISFTTPGDDYWRKLRNLFDRVYWYHRYNDTELS